MDARERWQALQSRLTAARACLERGDRDQALAEVNAALEIDPSFLAAVSLRDRIISGEPIVAAESAVAAPAAVSVPESRVPNPASSRPLVSADGYARFEQRARRRRADRKIEAARLAISRRRLRDAAAALDEVIELDPNLPELAELTAAFDALRRHRTRSHFGPALAAAGLCAVVLFGATRLRVHEPHVYAPRVLEGRWAPAIGGLADGVEPAALDVDAVDLASDAAPVDENVTIEPQPTPTSGVARSPIVRAPLVRPMPDLRTAPEPIAPPPVPRSAPQPVAVTPPPQQSRVVAPPPSAVTPPPAVVTAPLAVVTAPPAPSFAPSTASSAPAVIVPSPASAAAPAAARSTPAAVSTAAIDEAQIHAALQRYRSAYEGLDAREARAVWPAVNEAALARAFDSLQSQSLTFDACDVRLQGDGALATCRGTMRYVPKVGSHEPRVEPRSWTFALRRAGTEWKIESARAER